MTQLAALLDGMMVKPTPTESPHEMLDRGFDYGDCQNTPAAWGHTAFVPPRVSAEQSLPSKCPDRHPPRRCIVEMAHIWFYRFRRLPACTEKQGSHYLSFSHFPAVLIIHHKVRNARLLSR